MRTKFTALLFALCLLATEAALGNGLSLNSIGPRSLGMGGAFVGLANDYSAIYWNPAGLTNIQKAQIGVFVSDIIPSGSYKWTMPAALGGTVIDAKTKANHYISPNIMGYVPLLSGDLTVGIGAYVPAGLGAEWDGEELKALNQPGKGPYEWMNKIAVFNISPGVAYKINDMFSVGAAMNIYYGMLDMKRPMDVFNMATQQPGKDGAMDTQYDESSTGLGFGASIGALIRPIEWMSIGVSFKTQTTVAFEGTANLAAFAAYQAEESDFSRDLAWPMWVAGGIAIMPIENLTIALDAQYSQWSKSEDEIETEFKNAIWNASMDESSKKMKMKWEDALQIRFGVQYDFSEDFSLRLGFYNDPAPAPDSTLNIVFPSQSYNTFTIGASYKVAKNIGIDFGGEYLMGDEREVPFNIYDSAMPGTHTMDIIAVSLGVYYIFE